MAVGRPLFPTPGLPHTQTVRWIHACTLPMPDHRAGGQSASKDQHKGKIYYIYLASPAAHCTLPATPPHYGHTIPHLLLHTTPAYLPPHTHHHAPTHHTPTCHTTAHLESMAMWTLPPHPTPPTPPPTCPPRTAYPPPDVDVHGRRTGGRFCRAGSWWAFAPCVATGVRCRALYDRHHLRRLLALPPHATPRHHLRTSQDCTHRR